MQLMLLGLLLLLFTELLEDFKRLVSTQEDLDLVEKEQIHTAHDRFLNNNGVPVFLPVGVNEMKTVLHNLGNEAHSKVDNL
jgi:hypothetical protein